MDLASQTYNIKIDLFEGPFDLLLFFIKRDELDIYDIPITKITDDFLDYIHSLESLNLNVASEFILTAATLIRIKTKMLLPRKEVDEFGNIVDPRTSLVEKLLEYKKFKSVLDDFRVFEEQRAKMFKRGNAVGELKKIAQTALLDAEMESLSLYKLMKAFNNVMKKYEENKSKKVHTVHFYKYKVKDQKNYILKKLKSQKRLAFGDVFGSLTSKIHAVITFLALLEMLTAGDVQVVLGQGANNFWVEKK